MRALRAVSILCAALLLSAVNLRAALQFDLFPGYGAEACIHEGAWFPITCEVFNDGPPFNAVIEVAADQNGEQIRRVPVELPTNTRKRIVIPMFADGGPMGRVPQWSGKLVDSSGKVRQERNNVGTRIISWESYIFGALSKTFGGSPVLPEMKGGRSELKPEVARMTLDQFPDNAITLEGLNTFYLNSEKAPDLKVNQVTALLAWVREGGHLVVAAEEPADINGTPWLKQFLPMELSDVRTLKLDTEVLDWVRAGERGAVQSGMTAGGRRTRRTVQNTGNGSLEIPFDASFQEAEMPVATGKVRDGNIILAAQSWPLMVQAPRGRGKVTLLTFSPEREPFRSWKARSLFWAKLGGIPADLFTNAQRTGWGALSTDGVFGALIDSRQIRKLPVTWLLMLLVVYLVVIGPFDQWWLKKINRQMLTWITFPAYVVLFSLLIYFIGYKLRAGETEWNELNIVDVLPRGRQVDLWGRNYVSIYSSGNAWYDLTGQKGSAALRPEGSDFRSGLNSSAKLRVVHEGNSFKAEVFVPVWTSLLYANQWLKTNDTPFIANISEEKGGYTVEIENLLDRPLEQVRVVAGQAVFELPPVPAGAKKSVRLENAKGTPLRSFVQQNGSYFQRAVEIRRQVMGETAGGQLDDRPLTATTMSFISYLDELSNSGRQFMTSPGLDLTPEVERGDAVVFAWLPGYSFTEKLNNFRPPRFRQDTMLRLTLPLHSKNPI